MAVSYSIDLSDNFAECAHRLCDERPQHLGFHSHEGYEFMQIWSEGSVLCGSSVLPMLPGGIYFINALEGHCTAPYLKKPYIRSKVTVSAHYLHRLLEAIGQRFITETLFKNGCGGFIVPDKEGAAVFDRLFKRLYESSESKRPTAATELAALLLEMLSFIYRAVDAQESHSIGASGQVTAFFAGSAAGIARPGYVYDAKGGAQRTKQSDSAVISIKANHISKPVYANSKVIDPCSTSLITAVAGARSDMYDAENGMVGSTDIAAHKNTSAGNKISIMSHRNSSVEMKTKDSHGPHGTEKIPNPTAGTEVNIYEYAGYTRGLAAEAAGFISEHLTQPLSLDGIGKELHISKYHLCRLFKCEYGVSVMNYIKQRRINLAKGLLLKSDKSISEIALLSGFADFSTFSRAFKDAAGTTPSAFRKKFTFKLSR